MGKPRHPDPPPLRTNDVRPVLVGTVLWAVAFVALLPFHERLRDAGHLWWIATCAAGFGLGLIGLVYVRRRERAIARDEASHNEPGAAGT